MRAIIIIIIFIFITISIYIYIYFSLPLSLSRTVGASLLMPVTPPEAAYGTAKSGVGIASMGVMRPDMIMRLGHMWASSIADGGSCRWWRAAIQEVNHPSSHGRSSGHLWPHHSCRALGVVEMTRAWCAF